MKSNIKIKITKHFEVHPVNIRTPLKNSDFIELSQPKTNTSGLLDGFLKVFINHSVYDSIWLHAQSDQNEVGGALIGYYCQNGDVRFLIITDVLNMPPEYFNSPVSLKFTLDFIDDLEDYMLQINKNYPDLLRLGFYHTHPGYTVFLSGTDIRTFKGIFKEDWQIAMVVDPINQDEGIFFSQGNEISAKSGYIVYKSNNPAFQTHRATTQNIILIKNNKHIFQRVEE